MMIVRHHRRKISGSLNRVCSLTLNYYFVNTELCVRGLVSGLLLTQRLYRRVMKALYDLNKCTNSTEIPMGVLLSKVLPGRYLCASLLNMRKKIMLHASGDT